MHAALLHVNALDKRRKTVFWSAECEKALAQAEQVIAETPGRLLLAVYRQMREGGPQLIDPVGAPIVTTPERSRRLSQSDSDYIDGTMRSRWS